MELKQLPEIWDGNRVNMMQVKFMSKNDGIVHCQLGVCTQQDAPADECCEEGMLQKLFEPPSAKRLDDAE